MIKFLGYGDFKALEALKSANLKTLSRDCSGRGASSREKKVSVSHKNLMRFSLILVAVTAVLVHSAPHPQLMAEAERALLKKVA